MDRTFVRHALVIGSQSILGTYDEDELPAAATASIEADIGFLDDPDRAKADDVEAVIGEMSQFHQANGVYAEGVHVDTATYLPSVMPAKEATKLIGLFG